MMSELLEIVLGFFPAMAFAAAFITAAVEGLKRLGVVPDGYAGLVALALNAAFWFASTFASRLGYQTELVALVDVAALLLPIFLGGLGGLLSNGTFELLRKRMAG